MPGLYVTSLRPPIIAPTRDGLDLIVGVEAAPGELDERAPAIQYGGKAYRIWREVENFTNLGPDPYVYVVDRITGTITFAPSVLASKPDGQLEDTPRALAAVPAAEREIRLWYRRGGGPAGNVAANTLTVLKDPIAGVQVTNPEPATGGRAAETLENALIRGPLEFHSMQRAVTAQDFELIALTSSQAIARTRALTKAALWTYATPGTVEILLVPDLPGASGAQVTAAALRERETEEARAQIQSALDERRPLGTTCQVDWARYKTARVTARVVVRREEDLQAVKQRVVDRLYKTITPLPTEFNSTGWPFGQALRVSHVYDIALSEPAVRWVDRVRLLVDDVPGDTVTSIVADPNQPSTWYVASKATLYRSLNDGDGWEPVASYPNEQINLIEPHPTHPGLVAIASSLPNNSGSRLRVSQDCGDTWELATDLQAIHVQGLTWTLRDRVPILLMATDKGLYELAMQQGSSPVQLLVDPASQDMGFYAVSASRQIRGAVSIIVAAQNTRGVYLSTDGGQHFRQIGLQGEDIRTLAVQYVGERAFLWAGAFTAGGDDPGKGCFRWELWGLQDPPDRWKAFSQAWSGGSCKALAFVQTKVLAASHHAGVLWLNPDSPNTAWQAGRFLSVDTLDTVPAAPPLRPNAVLMAGGTKGVYRSLDEGESYQLASSDEFGERVTLPPTWLFVSGPHDVTVVSEDEANRN